MNENDDLKELKTIFFRIIVWIVVFNLVEMMLASSGNVTLRAGTGVPASRMYVMLLLYGAFWIWEYYDPFATDEIERQPDKKIYYAMGYAFMVSSLAILGEILILPIVIAIVCWVLNC